MVNRYQVIRQVSWLVPSVCLAFIFQMFFWGGTSSAFAGEKNYREVIGKARLGSQDLHEKLELAEFNQAFLKRVEEKFTQLRQDEIFRQKIREIPAGLKIQAYRSAFKQAEMQGFKLADHLRDLTEQKKTLLKGAQVGSISGTVTIEGSTPGDLSTTVDIGVYDSFGFFAGFTSADASGNYTISELEAGDYFVVTRSEFVDEFFSDIPLNFFESWRDATLVAVVDGQTTTGIDFDLASGAIVSGTVTEADGTTPIAGSQVNFEITAATNPEILFDITTGTGGSGEYQIVIPATGSFKIRASATGFISEYYNNKASFATADPIVIESLDETETGIDFSLERIEEPSGGTIIGNVFADTDPPTPLPFSFVFAFNVADTSISGFSVTQFVGDYEIDRVEPGSHVLYANNYLSPIFPLIPQVPFSLPVVQGQYYQDAEVSADAMPLTIATDEDTLTGINFNLTSGGTISGTITDENDTALDTV
ncbi:carboxypeptidase regulatory-like domain-containing protein, partial [candidate division KSB1 bacterium]|nr:carboxypeptidase regulatory-like domain-containing protein [candidate division KSB1 bacterium]NIR68559.1 carboxypeptidase regulatory-like domain-containing protein [candidate division KSB1 bacterium]NIS23963.1 carboxypeptidase regulatory-like domain-containing protein [candidate division KSB1 bacterium]NIT70886.1 carboxypeptidase regulatory-like domain-containing protein [candidate division KSB1 bacterium]NIU24616.1 carboxypeptidase regulatory-like domain-containing protein [candidate divisi